MDHTIHIFWNVELYPPPCLRHRLACGSPGAAVLLTLLEFSAGTPAWAWKVTETVTFPKNCH